MRRSRSFGSVLLLLVGCTGATPDDDRIGAAELAASPMHDVLLVGNSVSGTVSFVDGDTYENLGSVDVVPDLAQRLAAIQGDLVHAIAYGVITDHQMIKHFEPANGQRFVVSDQGPDLRALHFVPFNSAIDITSERNFHCHG